ncbi:pseudouridine synthase [Larkinella harenae]
MSKRREESGGRQGDRREGSGRSESSNKFYSKFSRDTDRRDTNAGNERRERSFDKPRGERLSETGRRFDQGRPEGRPERPRFERSDDRPRNDERRSFDRAERGRPRNDGPREGRFEGDRPRRDFDRPRESRDGDRSFRSDKGRFDRNDNRSRFEGGGPRRDFDRSREPRNDDRDNRRGNDRFERGERGNDRFGGERSFGDRPRFGGNRSEGTERRDDRFGNERGYGERTGRGRFSNDDAPAREPRDGDRGFRSDRGRFDRNDNRSRFEGGGPRRDFDRNQSDRPRRDDRENRFERPRRDEGDDAYRRQVEDSRERRVGLSRAPEYNIDKMRDKAFKGRGTRDTRGKRPGQQVGRSERVDSQDNESGLIRLNRYIANAGICSRRDADALIAQGDVSVNGKVVTEMGYKVQPTDVVKYGNRVLNPEKMTYVLLNKPKDYITTTDDPNDRHTVMELVAGATPYRIYPVGRLDRNTTGLLLLTNDGELAEKLTHPSNEIKKVYQVEIDKPITDEHFEAIRDGIELEDGFVKPDDLSIVTPDAHVVGIEIHSGRNRIVRRIFEHFGYEVTKLDRTVYAGLTKKELPRGSWRYLDEKEVIRLKFLL